MAKYLAIDPATKLPTETSAIDESAGAGDAGKIPALDSSGRLDESFMPVGIGADVAVIAASEALSAGSYVNIYDDSGTPKCRKADCTAAGGSKRAHGFVLDGVASGANATVYFEGSNTALTGLAAGTEYVLDPTTPGGVVARASGPTTAGHALQSVGVATSATAINTEIGEVVIRG